ncbi:MepB family protein [Bdellovibrio svalbardensis]|uniref:MepB family protein n=1 Tax=Bdellovibrio svalbardensis TaxID=2972972 RepID=UPI002407A0BF|nr:MepB family protein [Bdellovibrio svalbardensis]
MKRTSSLRFLKLTNKRSWSQTTAIHKDLLAAKELIFDPCGYLATAPTAELESAEYGAYVFELNKLSIKFRVAKITPTKVGQFVTLWKRYGSGPIQPHDSSDPVDIFVISTRNGSRFGQFVFPKSALIEHGILSTPSKEGKRALRVYPPWDQVTSKQAKKTQQWQLDFFLEIPNNKAVDLERTQYLYRKRSK